MVFPGYPARAVAIALFLLASAGPAFGQTDEGTATRMPWSGYWWPHNEGQMRGPLAKYDLYTGEPNAVAWENKFHPTSNNKEREWWGYCHAWAAASVWEHEPTRPISLTT